MKALKNKVLKSHDRYEFACEQYEIKIRKVCDFKARLTWCPGDGHLILNEDTSSVATLNCLNGRTVKNKLTQEEHLKYCI
tara:strand:+ start:137 stop:376 length:240 start_codon:yes stop_codon:yes gene_type:complete